MLPQTNIIFPASSFLQHDGAAKIVPQKMDGVILLSNKFHSLAPNLLQQGSTFDH